MVAKKNNLLFSSDRRHVWRERSRYRAERRRRIVATPAARLYLYQTSRASRLSRNTRF